MTKTTSTGMVENMKELLFELVWSKEEHRKEKEFPYLVPDWEFTLPQNSHPTRYHVLSEYFQYVC